MTVVVAGMSSIVSTCIIPQDGTKSYKGVAVIAVVLVVSDQTDSYPAPSWRNSVEPFLVTVWLQRGGRPNKGHPRATTEMGGSVMPIRDQWVKGWRLLVNYNKSNLVVYLHSEADLWEICAPVTWQLGLPFIKPGHPAREVEGFLVAPVAGLKVEGFLKWKTEKIHVSGNRIKKRMNDQGSKRCWTKNFATELVILPIVPIVTS